LQTVGVGAAGAVAVVGKIQQNEEVPTATKLVCWTVIEFQSTWLSSEDFEIREQRKHGAILD